MWSEFQKFARTRGNEPFVTWLGEAGRIELSGVTYMNAVSKAANMLVDGLECDENSTVDVRLGNHWQSSVWLGAVLANCLSLANDADVSLWNLHYDGGQEPNSQNPIYICRDPYGMADSDVPTEAENGSLLVRGFGDHFSPRWPADLADPKLTLGGQPGTYAQLMSNASTLAETFGIVEGMRYAVVGDYSQNDRLLLHVALPLLLGCSVVLVDREFSDEVEKALNSEKVTHVVQPQS